MNYFDQDESPDWADDADALEEQLRSLQPTPPTQSWSSMAESIAASNDLAGPVTTAPATVSVWRPIISHSITAAVGLAAGVVIMLTQASSNTGATSEASTDTSSQSPVELVDSPALNQSTASDQAVLADDELASSRQEVTRQSWRSQRFIQSDFHPGPLRAFGSIDNRLATNHGRYLPLNINTDQRFSPPEDLGTYDTQSNQIDDVDHDEPVLSPRSMHLFLDDLTYSPTPDKRFPNLEGYSS